MLEKQILYIDNYKALGDSILLCAVQDYRLAQEVFNGNERLKKKFIRTFYPVYGDIKPEEIMFKIEQFLEGDLFKTIANIDKKYFLELMKKGKYNDAAYRTIMEDEE